MFTPPPSPSPPTLKFEKTDVDRANDDILSPTSSSSAQSKRTASRRTRWAVLVVPLLLILISGTTRFLTHPAALDLLSGSHPQGHWKPSLTDWRPHKRHPAPQASGTSSSAYVFPTAPPTSSSPTSTTSATTTTPAAQAVPTIPSVAPTLPTPFPQPFDTSLQANFSSQGCENFFLNMTSTTAFTSCRPFSLLLQSSNAFSQVS